MGPQAGEVTVRPFRPEDEGGLLRLLIAGFGRWPGREVTVSPAEHLHWKLRSDEEALASHVVAEAGGRIVGCRLFRLFDVATDGRSLRASWGSDVAVHPDFRGLGVMTRVYGFSHALLCRSIDLQFSGNTKVPAVRRLNDGEGLEPFGNLLDLLERPAGATSAAGENAAWTIGAPAQLDERFDAFWDDARRPFEFITKRDRSALNWRYCDVRGGSFQVRTAEQEGRVLAYAVYKREHDKGYIADLLALPGRLDALDGVVAEAVRHFDGAGLAAARCVLPSHHPYREVLLRHGFARRRRYARQCWGPLRTPASELGVLADPQAALHFTLGDTDLV
jgi:GNAT superfamily N-acetyltransferase